MATCLYLFAQRTATICAPDRIRFISYDGAQVQGNARALAMAAKKQANLAKACTAVGAPAPAVQPVDDVLRCRLTLLG